MGGEGEEGGSTVSGGAQAGEVALLESCVDCCCLCRDLFLSFLSGGLLWCMRSIFLPKESHGQRSLVGYVHGVTKSQT